MLYIRLSFFILCFCVTAGWSQTNTNQPHIGYLYPAGGQTGTTIQITAGGQFLRGANKVYVSGNGVHASVIKYIRPNTNFNKEERDEIEMRLSEVWNKRIAELNIDAIPLFRNNRSKRNLNKTAADPNNQQVKVPDHPLLYDLENKNIRELINIREALFFPREKRQQNRQLAETVLIKITIDANAAAGNRELRIETGQGLTNPVVFQVGELPEVCNLETGNQKMLARFPVLAELLKEKPLNLPVLINGQIMPGDADSFHFRAQAGQKLVIQTYARSLNPYLADAVPGWFQAITTLYDANGKEIAFDDDYRFNPDPVMFYKILKNGEYELQIRDSIYRGREDFVYRIAIGELPFVTQMFPLGGSEGVKTIAAIDGWNLAKTRLRLDTSKGNESVRQTFCQKNTIPYAVDTLPECNEFETNNTFNNSQKIDLPVIINGRIGKSGDIDMFGFKGFAGQKIAAEVFARQLNSPLDSLLRLTDESGKIIEWNDDFCAIEENYLYKDPTGLLTHHADSYMQAELPSDGNFCIQLSDSQNHGGKPYGYRLRISAPQPDFSLRMTPSSLNIRPGSSAAICVYVLRKDGYDGEITITLKDAPAGFEINGGVIPAGRSSIRITLTAPRSALTKPVSLQLAGSAKIGDKIITRPIVPCEDMMQAFLYRHLVPSQQLLAASINAKWPVPPIERNSSFPVKMLPDGETQITYKIQNRPIYKQLKFELNQPPEGLTLQDVNISPEGLVLKLKADKKMKSGFKDNLIIEVSTEITPRNNRKSKNQKQIVSMGVLPAVPIVIE
ncbi:MAG: hypothetical protein A2Y10_03595 [Planctomycetes bacterium GWF2_41_51]|nr:MAG: hypothetical protein A2Y10_03595 [Planctomycetes bacterium GWF2_41_51]HBG28827.1 hypothetical protein [Phycisphaerales bacterium]